MRHTGAPRLASRLMLAQVLVVAVGAVTPVIAALLIAPRLFHMHLLQADVANSEVTFHAEEAFRSAMGIAVALGVVMSLLAAGIISWFLVRRIAAPIEQLVDATRDVAAGLYDVDMPSSTFSRELSELADSFDAMTKRIADAGEARTRMLADLAHEVRTPLATLHAYVDGLEDGVIPINDEAWTIMRREIDRLKRLADDIRAVAQAEEQQIELVPMDGCDAVHAAVTVIAPRFHAKGVHLSERPSAVPCHIQGDPLRMQQVLGNLLDNALRHTPTEGSVVVSTAQTGGRFLVQVTDSGEGIPADQLEAVFERLHRVDPSRTNADGSGSGLGLTIARAIVQAHGGSIRAESRGRGLGTTFTIDLPLATSDTKPRPPTGVI